MKNSDKTFFRVEQSLLQINQVICLQILLIKATLKKLGDLKKFFSLVFQLISVFPFQRKQRKKGSRAYLNDADEQPVVEDAQSVIEDVQSVAERSCEPAEDNSQRHQQNTQIQLLFNPPSEDYMEEFCTDNEYNCQFPIFC